MSRDRAQVAKMNLLKIKNEDEDGKELPSVLVFKDVLQLEEQYSN